VSGPSGGASPGPRNSIAGITNNAGIANSGTSMTDPLARLSTGNSKIPISTAARAGTLAPPARMGRV